MMNDERSLSHVLVRLRGGRIMISRKHTATILFWVLLSAVLVLAFQSADETLLSRVRERIADNIRDIPRYTCVETVNRARYATVDRPGRCEDVIARATKGNRPGGRLTWHDRLRLEVAVGRQSDLYLWVATSRFDNDEVSQLATKGMSASGEFSSVLAGIFGGGADDFRLLSDSGGLTSFGFVTPLAKSRYRYSGVTLGYRGIFVVDAVSGDLRHLSITTDNPPRNICRLENTLDYARLKVGTGEFTLPTRSTTDVIFRSGVELLNETSYSGCRQYAGESTIRFDVDGDPAAPVAKSNATTKPMPAGIRLRVRIVPAINLTTAAAGDPIIGTIVTQVRDKGDLVADKGDKLHGRILRLEEATGRYPAWTVALAFDYIERADMRQKIALKAVRDGDRTGYTMVPSVIPASERPVGGGVFVFASSLNQLVAGLDFESEWETQPR